MVLLKFRNKLKRACPRVIKVCIEEEENTNIILNHDSTGLKIYFPCYRARAPSL